MKEVMKHCPYSLENTNSEHHKGAMYLVYVLYIVSTYK